MKVEGVGPGGAPSTRKTEKKSQTSAAFGTQLRRSMAEGEDGKTAGVELTQAAAPMDGLLALQEVDAVDGVGTATDQEQRRRQAQRGEQLLDALEEVRIGLIDGAVPKAQLVDLARMVRTKREAGADRQIAAILDEIELRAEVELAKLTRR
ncbi:MAG: flagellar assembly protein FliX [Rhodospirillaceae bacterium]